MPGPLSDHPLADPLVVEAGRPAAPSTPSRLFRQLGLRPGAGRAARQRRLSAWLATGAEPSPLLRQLLEGGGWDLAVPAPAPATGLGALAASARARISSFTAWVEDERGRRTVAPGGPVFAGSVAAAAVVGGVGPPDEEDLAVRLDGGSVLRVSRRGREVSVELVAGPPVSVDGRRVDRRAVTLALPPETDVVDWLSARLALA